MDSEERTIQAILSEKVIATLNNVQRAIVGKYILDHSGITDRATWLELEDALLERFCDSSHSHIDVRAEMRSRIGYIDLQSVFKCLSPQTLNLMVNEFELLSFIDEDLLPYISNSFQEEVYSCISGEANHTEGNDLVGR